MELHEWCERETARISGGKLTPGSGNKRIRGDVYFKDDRVRIEVKSTINPDKINIQSSWLTTLENLADKRSVCLVIWFGDKTGYVYYHSFTKNKVEDWKTLTVYKDNMPDTLRRPNSTWELDSIYSLVDFCNE